MLKRPGLTTRRSLPPAVFGRRVRAFRLARGLSQIQLGHLAERHFTFVSEIEGGKNATLATLFRLARALGVDPGVLVTDDERQFTRALREVRKASPPRRTGPGRPLGR
jgi:transcriptional regulator with XRE-family HTH domain